MIKLSARELRILIVTAILVGGSVTYLFAIEPLLNRYTDLQERLDRERDRFEQNVEILHTALEIEKDYRAVEAQFPQDSDDISPRAAFSEDVDSARQMILPGERSWYIEPVKSEPIPGADGYEFLTLAMSTTGELDQIARLLKGFDQRGFLIRSLTLSQNRGVDSPELRLDLTLARIVKIEDEDPDSPRRPSAVRRPVVRR